LPVSVEPGDGIVEVERIVLFYGGLRDMPVEPFIKLARGEGASGEIFPWIDPVGAGVHAGLREQSVAAQNEEFVEV
jgi:hypothetical protein